MLGVPGVTGVLLTLGPVHMPWCKVGYGFRLISDKGELVGEGQVKPFNALMAALSDTLNRLLLLAAMVVRVKRACFEGRGRPLVKQRHSVGHRTRGRSGSGGIAAGRANSMPPDAMRSWHSVRTASALGMRPRQRHGTGRSRCTRCWTGSSFFPGRQMPGLPGSPPVALSPASPSMRMSIFDQGLLHTMRLRFGHP